MAAERPCTLTYGIASFEDTLKTSPRRIAKRNPSYAFVGAPLAKRMKPTVATQQVIDRLAERWTKASRSRVICRLGTQSRRRRGGPCSACRYSQEFEIDEAIAWFIDSAAFKRAGVCPYQVVTSHLVAGLTLGPDVSRARRAGRPRVDPVLEVKAVLKRLGSLLYATGPSRDDIEAIAISNHDDWWQALNAIVMAERSLKNALALFQSQTPVTTHRLPRGRTGNLGNQAVARAMAGAWRELTGRLPAKDNSKFHGLLLAAVATLFGHPANEPNCESLTKTAVERIRSDAATRS